MKRAKTLTRYSIRILEATLLSLVLNSLLYGQTVSVSFSPEYLGFIQQKINSAVIYPNAAKLNGWEGISKVKFTLADDGRIKEIDIVESSGYPLLDASAIMAVKDASPYPFPSNYAEHEIEIMVPVNYGGLTAKQQKTTATTTATDGKIEPNLLQNEDLQLMPQAETSTPLLPQYSGDQLEEKLASLPQELSKFIKLSIEKNPPLQVALEEVELAHLKVTEAQRNFLPALKITTYSTDGEVYKIGYAERETKTQIDQPIYYSGRLQDTLKQAQVNMEITKGNYDRLKQDIIQKTEAAYYNLVASKMHLKEKETVKEEVQELLGKVEKLGSTGMVIPLEVNSARSWFEMMEVQIKSIQQEIRMAELTFKQVLNLPEIPEVKNETLELKKIDLDLTTCVEIAFQNRPEVHLSELLTKFNDYGKKIEDSKGKFSVDLTSSYGLYQGHYKTEPWLHSTNWYAGVKVSKPWGPNTINGSYSRDQSQPRFGQTSPTMSSTLSAEFNVLDNMKLLSDKKRATIDYTRALSDLNETLKTVIFEVQDSFLKYKKAVFQVDAAETEMKFRKTEAEVTKARALAGEGSVSGSLESLYAYSEAQTKYLQALANYYLSLANLKKATGYGLTI